MKHAAIFTALSLGMLLPASATASRSAGPSELAPVQLADDAKKVAVAEVIVLHATNGGKGIDPELRDLPQLKSPPFSSYDSYELLEREKLKLEPAGEMSLPGDGKLAVTLESTKGSGEDTRYVVDAKVLKKDGDKFASASFNAKQGQYFFLAGQRYDKGILVLGIRIAPKK